jgi:hypothetical protein
MKITHQLNPRLLLLVAPFLLVGCNEHGTSIITGPKIGTVDSDIRLDAGGSKSFTEYPVEWRDFKGPDGTKVTECSVSTKDRYIDTPGNYFDAYTDNTVPNNHSVCNFIPDVPGRYSVTLLTWGGDTSQGTNVDGSETHYVNISENIATTVSIVSLSKTIEADADRTSGLLGFVNSTDDELIYEWSVEYNNCVDEPSFSDPLSLSTVLTVGQQVDGLDCTFSLVLTANPASGEIGSDRTYITVMAPLVTGGTGSN